jgi:hypothetical protein
MYTLGSIVIQGVAKACLAPNTYFSDSVIYEPRKDEKKAPTDSFLLVYSLLSSLLLASSARSFECFFSKCITSIPISKYYAIVALPPILFIAQKLLGKFEKLGIEKTNPVRIGSNISTVIFDCLSTISSVAMLILLRSSLFTNPLLFSAAVIVTAIDIIGKANFLCKFIPFTKPNFLTFADRFFVSKTTA